MNRVEDRTKSHGLHEPTSTKVSPLAERSGKRLPRVSTHFLRSAWKSIQKKQIVLGKDRTILALFLGPQLEAESGFPALPSPTPSLARSFQSGVKDESHFEVEQVLEEPQVPSNPKTDKETPHKSVRGVFGRSATTFDHQLEQRRNEH